MDSNKENRKWRLKRKQSVFLELVALVRIMMFAMSTIMSIYFIAIFNKKHFIDEQKYASILEELAVQRSNPSEDKYINKGGVSD